MMDQQQARAIFDDFLSDQQEASGHNLAAIDSITEQLSVGWAFYYQSTKYIESGEMSDMLVGQGPVVILNNGTVLEGGSADADGNAVVERYAS
jgi:Immunity protein 35